MKDDKNTENFQLVRVREILEGIYNDERE